MKKKVFLSSLVILFMMNGCAVANSTYETPSLSSTNISSLNSNSNAKIHALSAVGGGEILIQETKNGFLFPQFKDKIVILEIFGKDCPHCLKQMPILNAIKSSNPHKIEIIGIHAQEPMNNSEIEKLFSQHNIHYPIIDGQQSHNLQYFIRDTYGWDGTMPYILIIKNGLTEFSYSGETDFRELQNNIQSIL